MNSSGYSYADASQYESSTNDKLYESTIGDSSQDLEILMQIDRKGGIDDLKRTKYHLFPFVFHEEVCNYEELVQNFVLPGIDPSVDLSREKLSANSFSIENVEKLLENKDVVIDVDRFYVYSGGCENSKFTGVGDEYFDDDTMKYRGSFYRNMYCGLGRLYNSSEYYRNYNPSRILYFGTFLNGLFHGKGAFYYGTYKYKAEFVRGEIVSSVVILVRKKLRQRLQIRKNRFFSLSSVLRNRGQKETEDEVIKDGSTFLLDEGDDNYFVRYRGSVIKMKEDPREFEYEGSTMVGGSSYGSSPRDLMANNISTSYLGASSLNNSIGFSKNGTAIMASETLNPLMSSDNPSTALLNPNPGNSAINSSLQTSSTSIPHSTFMGEDGIEYWVGEDGHNHFIGVDGLEYWVGDNGYDHYIGDDGLEYWVGDGGFSYFLGEDGIEYWVGDDGYDHFFGNDGLEYWVADDQYTHYYDSNGQEFKIDSTGNRIFVESSSENMDYIPSAYEDMENQMQVIEEEEEDDEEIKETSPENPRERSPMKSISAESEDEEIVLESEDEMILQSNSPKEEPEEPEKDPESVAITTAPDATLKSMKKKGRKHQSIYNSLSSRNLNNSLSDGSVSLNTIYVNNGTLTHWDDINYENSIDGKSQQSATHSMSSRDTMESDMSKKNSVRNSVSISNSIDGSVRRGVPLKELIEEEKKLEVAKETKAMKEEVKPIDERIDIANEDSRKRLSSRSASTNKRDSVRSLTTDGMIDLTKLEAAVAQDSKSHGSLRKMMDEERNSNMNTIKDFDASLVNAKNESDNTSIDSSEGVSQHSRSSSSSSIILEGIEASSPRSRPLSTYVAPAKPAKIPFSPNATIDVKKELHIETSPQSPPTNVLQLDPAVPISPTNYISQASSDVGIPMSPVKTLESYSGSMLSAQEYGAVSPLRVPSSARSIHLDSIKRPIPLIGNPSDGISPLQPLTSSAEFAPTVVSAEYPLSTSFQALAPLHTGSGEEEEDFDYYYVPHGNGEEYYGNGKRRYSGYFKYGVYDGEGVLLLKNGDTYRGFFCEGEIHGKGQYFDASHGILYKGTFDRGIKNGAFDVVRSNGLPLFKGTYVNDYMEGKGRLFDIHCDGIMYEGEFHRSQLSGTSIHIYYFGILLYYGDIQPNWELRKETKDKAYDELWEAINDNEKREENAFGFKPKGKNYNILYGLLLTLTYIPTCQGTLYYIDFERINARLDSKKKEDSASHVSHVSHVSRYSSQFAAAMEAIDYNDTPRVLYNGQFSNGTFNGVGTLYYNNENSDGRYTGFFTSNYFNGKGLYMDENGCSFEGEFCNGIMVGEVTIKNKKDALVFKGRVDIDFLMEGDGEYHMKDTAVVVGKWSHGELVSYQRPEYRDPYNKDCRIKWKKLLLWREKIRNYNDQCIKYKGVGVYVYHNGDYCNASMLSDGSHKLKTISIYSYNGNPVYCGELNSYFEATGKGIIYAHNKEDCNREYCDWVWKSYGIYPYKRLEDEKREKVKYSFMRPKETSNLIVEYDGELFDGVLHGNGLLYFAEEIHIEGEWKYGILERGRLFDHNEVVYVGEFKKGQREGKGLAYSKNRLVYEGMFEHDNYNGKGILYDDETGCRVYRGFFKENMYEGRGVIYDNRDKYWIKGHYHEGAPIGVMNEYDENYMLCYQGEMNGTNRNGVGSMYYGNRRYEGVFHENVLSLDRVNVYERVGDQEVLVHSGECQWMKTDYGMEIEIVEDKENGKEPYVFERIDEGEWSDWEDEELIDLQNAIHVTPVECIEAEELPAENHVFTELGAIEESEEDVSEEIISVSTENEVEMENSESDVIALSDNENNASHTESAESLSDIISINSSVIEEILEDMNSPEKENMSNEDMEENRQFIMNEGDIQFSSDEGTDISISGSDMSRMGDSKLMGHNNEEEMEKKKKDVRNVVVIRKEERVAKAEVEEDEVDEVKEDEVDEVKEDEVDEVKEDGVDEVKEDEVKVDEVDEVKEDGVDEVKVDEVKEDEVDEVKEDEVDEVKEDEVDEVKEDGVDEVKEEGVDEVKEDGVKEDGVKEDGVDEVKEDEVDEVKEDEVDEVKEDEVDEVKEDEVDEVKEEIEMKEDTSPRMNLQDVISE